MKSIEKIRSQKHSVLLFLVLILGGLSFLFLPYIGFDKILITLVVYFFTTCIGGTILYHRYLSHKSFVCPKWFFYFASLCSVWGLYGTPLAWAAIHRQHHQSTDTEKDPHSPLFKRWWEVQFLSSLETPNLMLIQDLTRNKFLVFLHKRYLLIHLVITIALLLISPAMFLYLYLWPAFLTWNIASLTNNLGHTYGYRNFETNDASRNFWPLAILVFGEGWHNNHHANPGKYSFKQKWWEFDIAGSIIGFIKK